MKHTSYFFTLVFIALWVLFFLSPYSWIFDQIDTAVSLFMSENIWETWVFLSTILSYFGIPEIVGAVFLLALVWVLLSRNKAFFWGLVLSILSVSIITTSLKFLFARNRPELALYSEVGYSFPSFHASIAFWIFWYIAYYFIKEKHSIHQNFLRYIVILLAASMAVWVWASRIILGVHYLSDVLAWFLVWSVCLGWSYYLSQQYFLSSKRFQKHTSQNSFTLVFTVFLIFASLYFPQYYQSMREAFM